MSKQVGRLAPCCGGLERQQRRVAVKQTHKAVSFRFITISIRRSPSVICSPPDGVVEDLTATTAAATSDASIYRNIDSISIYRIACGNIEICVIRVSIFWYLSSCRILTCGVKTWNFHWNFHRNFHWQWKFRWKFQWKFHDFLTPHVKIPQENHWIFHCEKIP